MSMTLHTAIARSSGNKATTHLDGATELIVQELSFLLPLRHPEDPGTIIKRYDVMHITTKGLMERWASCTPSEMLHALNSFGIDETSMCVWEPL